MAMLHEFGRAEVRLVKQFETDTPAFWQSGGRHLEAHLGKLCRRHEDRRSAFAEPEVHAAFPQLLHHGAGVFRSQGGVERPEIAFTFPLHKGEDAGAHHQRGCYDGDALHDRKIR